MVTLHPLLKKTRYATLNWASLPLNLKTLLSHEKRFQPFKPSSVLNIINHRHTKLDSKVNVVVVSSENDFPMGIPPGFASMLHQRGMSINDVNFVVNKTDLVRDPAVKHYRKLLSQYLNHPISVANITINGKNNQKENNDKLFQNLTKNSNDLSELIPTYFVGPLNSGKSTLVKNFLKQFYPEGLSQNPNFGISDKLSSHKMSTSVPRIWEMPHLKIVDVPGWVDVGDNIDEFGGIFAHVNGPGRSHILDSIRSTIKPPSGEKIITYDNNFKSFQIDKLIIIQPKGRFGEKFTVTLSGDIPNRPLTQIKPISNVEAVELTKKDMNPFIMWPKWKSEMVSQSQSFELILGNLGTVCIESSQVCDWKITTPKLVPTAVLQDGELHALEPLSRNTLPRRQSRDQ